MASKAGLTWRSDTLTPAWRAAIPRANAYLAKTTAYYSLRSETYAKGKARWTDRTGNARSGLTGVYDISSQGARGSYRIEVFHKVNYGIWLEVRFNQKYAIINKTIEYNGQRFFETANQVMARMFGGS